MKKKKRDAEPEMGYYPFEHKVGLGMGRARVRDRQARDVRQAGAWRTTGKRGACGARAAQALGPRSGCRRVAWACCWVVGCALGAFSLFLTQFLDSILFLSQFIDIVHEHCSSQKKFGNFFY